MKYTCLLIVGIVALGGCASTESALDETGSPSVRDGFLQNASLQISAGSGAGVLRAHAEDRSVCAVSGSTAAYLPKALGEIPITPGDLLRVTLPGQDEPMGVFKVDREGGLTVSGIGVLPVAGLNMSEAGRELDHLLAAKHMPGSGSGHAKLSPVGGDTDRIMWLARCVTQGKW